MLKKRDLPERPEPQPMSRRREGVFEVEEFKGAVGHGGLYVLDSGRGGVFAGFGIIVMEIWGSGSFVRASESRIE